MVNATFEGMKVEADAVLAEQMLRLNRGRQVRGEASYLLRARVEGMRRPRWVLVRGK